MHGSDSPIQVCPPNLVLSNHLMLMQNQQQSRDTTLHQHISVQIPISSTLANKQVASIKCVPSNGIDKNPNIFSRFQHEITGAYGQTILTNQVKYAQEVKRNPSDVLLRYQLAYQCLLLMEILTDEIKNPRNPKDSTRVGNCKAKLETLSGRVKFESESAKTINSLHPLSYYIDCLILEYKGVDCTDIAQVEEYVRLLKLCLALDPQAAEIQQNLNEVKEFLQNRWSALEKEGTIDATTHNAWQQKLESIVTSDPKDLNDSLNDSLKDLFRSKPSLFNLARLTTHTTFFAQHPELKSKQAFVARYPQCAKELGLELPKPIQQSTQQVVSPTLANSGEKENIQPNQLTEKTPNSETLQAKESGNIKYSIQTIDEIVEQRLPLSKCILLDLIPVRGSDGTPELIFLDKQKAEEFVSQFAVTKQNGSFILKGIRHKIMIAPQHLQSKLREKLHTIVFQKDATGNVDSKSSSTSSFLLEIWRTELPNTLS